MSVQVLAYVPVLHRGYQALLGKWAVQGEVLLLGESFAAVHPAVRKDARSLPAATVRDYLVAAGVAPSCRVIEVGDLPAAVSADLLVIPDDEVCRAVVREHSLDQGRRVHREPAFVRWDRTNTLLRKHEPRFAARLPVDELTAKWSSVARAVGERSADWWRQVGAVAVRDGQPIAWAHNRHEPTEFSAYVDGDPRSNFSQGKHFDLGTAIHAEAALVAGAARDGVALAGADLFVSTFPCPACARLVANAGFARCLYQDGYSVLDGERILEAGGVQVVYVESGPADVAQISLEDLEGQRILDSLG